MRGSNRGFTLIELLVAVAILAIIGVMAFVGLNRVIEQQTIAREHTERWQKIQLAMRLVTQDLAQLHPRATREELGESYQPSMFADPSAQFALEFSRGGWANPAGVPRGTWMTVRSPSLSITSAWRAILSRPMRGWRISPGSAAGRLMLSQWPSAAHSERFDHKEPTSLASQASSSSPIAGFFTLDRPMAGRPQKAASRAIPSVPE